MREREFDCQNLMGYKAFMLMFDERQGVSFNNLIQDTNKFIGSKSFSNSVFYPHNEFTSYVRGKHINYSPYVMNSLLNLQPPSVCEIQNRRSHNHRLGEQMCEIMKNEFCRPISKWVIVNGVALRLFTSHICPIPKAWAYFIVQTLE